VNALELSPEQVRAMLGSEDMILLDCRREDELQRACIEGAMHVPMEDLAARIDEIDEEKTVVVMCHHGIRSLSVAAVLRSNGFDEAYSMAGGIDRWSIEIDQVVPRY
jgi:rhodanese-related sulfurtransferase